MHEPEMDGVIVSAPSLVAIKHIYSLREGDREWTPLEQMNILLLPASHHPLK